MVFPISLDEVAEQLDGLMDQWTAFVNRETGEIVAVSADDRSLIEDSEWVALPSATPALFS